MEIIDASNLAPSPGNLDIIRYLIVEDFDTKEKISEACRQPFIKDAPFLVVICSDITRVKIMYGERAEKYTRQTAGAVIENFLLKAVNNGFVSCWIGAFDDNIVKEILSIPESIEVEAILPVAYKHKLDKTKQKEKPNLINRVFFHSYKNKFYKLPEKVRRDDI